MRGVASGAVPAVWTREQIDAWLDLRSGEQPRDADEARTMRAARRTIVRLCPEAADYHALSLQLRSTGIKVAKHTLTDAEQEALTERAIAALWQQSLSAPFDGDAA